MGIFKKVLDRRRGQEAQGPRGVVPQVNALRGRVPAGSVDDELRAKTAEFKQRLENGEPTSTTSSPRRSRSPARAADRAIGQRHFDVQIMGGAALHQGWIAEMKTGEGKTLTATLAVYLNALWGEGVHLVTVNDYLAKRDSEWMGQVYRFLGLTDGLDPVADVARASASPRTRRTSRTGRTTSSASTTSATTWSPSSTASCSAVTTCRRRRGRLDPRSTRPGRR